MLSTYEKQSIIASYEEVNKKIRSKWKKVFLRMSLFMLVILAMLIGFIGWKDNLELQIFSYIFGGLSMLFLLISYLVGTYMYSPKATYTDLFPKLVDKLNFYEDLSLRYEPYNKDYKIVNKESQLFTRGASVTINSSLSGMNEHSEPWIMHDLRMVVSTGQSASIVFDGFLFKLSRPNKVCMQLRTGSRPSNKPVKFRKEDKIGGYKLFVEDGENIPSNTDLIVRKLDEIASMFHVKHLYFSAMKDATYLAIQSKSLPRKQTKLKEEDISNLYHALHEYSKVMNMLGGPDYDL